MLRDLPVNFDRHTEENGRLEGAASVRARKDAGAARDNQQALWASPMAQNDRQGARGQAVVEDETEKIEALLDSDSEDDAGAPARATAAPEPAQTASDAVPRRGGDSGSTSTRVYVDKTSTGPVTHRVGRRLLRAQGDDASPASGNLDGLLDSDDDDNNNAGSNSAAHESAGDLADVLAGLSVANKAPADAGPPSAAQSASDAARAVSSHPAGTMRDDTPPPRTAHSRQGSDEAPTGPGEIRLPGGGFRLPRDAERRLYAHQVQGVRWLLGLWQRSKGGIIGDDMGMGKTMQTSAFLAGLIAGGAARRALVVAPKSLVEQWAAELRRCGLDAGGRVVTFYEAAPGARAQAMSAAFRGGAVLVTTYGMLQHNAPLLAGDMAAARALGGDALAGDAADAVEAADAGLWDVIALDEGHKIKNAKMQLAQKVRGVPARMRVVISGTPIQNNLLEMWALFDFVYEGLLGDAKWFRDTYERPISRGAARDATPREVEASRVILRDLQATIGPYFLRREKKSHASSSTPAPAPTATDAAPASQVSAVAPPASGPRDAERPKMGTLGHKNDLIVWLRLRPLQRVIYEAFLGSSEVRQALNSTQSPLAALTVLKKGGEAVSGEWWGWAAAHRGSLDDAIVDALRETGADASCKTAFVVSLCEELVARGHRTLVFSQSRKMLDILEADVRARGWRFCRIDGTVSSVKARQAEVDKFQSDTNIPLFLLTSGVGGLGLTLTAADRVVIVDPSWNPATDNQSVDRAYRIGQSRDVVVYRLITCGTVEEKIYRKQVFKQGLARAAQGGADAGEEAALRYFTQSELRQLFEVTAAGLQASETQAQLHEMHAQQRRVTPELQRHLDWLAGVDGYAGISDHDLLYVQDAADTSGTPQPRQTVQSRRGAAPEWTRGVGTGAKGGAMARKMAAAASRGAAPGGVLDAIIARDNAAKTSGPGGLPAAQVRGAGWLQPSQYSTAAAPQPPPAPKAPEEPKEVREARRAVDAAQAELQRARHMLPAAEKLPDGGARVHARVAELERTVAEKRRALAVATGEPVVEELGDAAKASAPPAEPSGQGGSERDLSAMLGRLNIRSRDAGEATGRGEEAKREKAEQGAARGEGGGSWRGARSGLTEGELRKKQKKYARFVEGGYLESGQYSEKEQHVIRRRLAEYRADLAALEGADA
ncbi:unnamed protein product [Pedinophyceae sp. YPF-701]|nr:unnamed protein product [Pedinophyceae sp. YPF-701]